MAAAHRSSTLTPLEHPRRAPAGVSRGPPRVVTASPALRPRRLRPDDWPAVLALADRRLGFPFDRLIRCTRAPQGWVLVDADARLVFVQLTRVVNVGRERLGVLGWALAEPRARRLAPSRALHACFERAYGELRAAGCTRLVVGDCDAYASRSWRLAHFGGYRRWTPAQQLRVLGWRWPASFWRLPHFGVRTFVLQRPIDGEPEPVARPGWGLLPAAGTALFVGALLLPLARAGGVWADAPLLAWQGAAWRACLLATLLHVAARALVQAAVARRRGLAVGFRVWDSGLVAASSLAALGVFVPGFAGAPYVRDELYDYRADRRDFSGVRAAGVLAGLVLSVGALVVLGLDADRNGIAAAVLAFGLWSGVTDTLPLGGPWSALAVGAVRRRHPRMARWCLATWCALLALAAARVVG